MSPFAARLVRRLDDLIEAGRDSLEMGLNSRTYRKVVGAQAAFRQVRDLIITEDRNYETGDDRDDEEQPTVFQHKAADEDAL